MTPLRPIVLLVLALLAVGGLTACGNEAHDPGEQQSENAQVAETEGIYLEIGEMKYQVQVSRQMNPAISEDRNYFDGVSESDLDIAKDEVWFGVWMRVENESTDPQEAATDYKIVDTQENEFLPIEIGEPNPFAYRASRVEGEELYPLPDSPAGERAPNGALLLFKLEEASLNNRPLELQIADPAGGPGAVVNLDV